MHRSTLLIMTLLAIYAVSAFSQAAAAPDPQSLQAILAGLRQLGQDLQTTSEMAARAQIALYRLQREDEAVARANHRVSDARTKVVQLEDAIRHKAHDIDQDQAVANRATTRADEQEPDRRPAMVGERANDGEAHIHQGHWW